MKGTDMISNEEHTDRFISLKGASSNARLAFIKAFRKDMRADHRELKHAMTIAEAAEKSYRDLYQKEIDAYLEGSES